MEFVETVERKICRAPCAINQTQQPENVKCKRTRKYVQPPRVKPFAPKGVYCPPKNSIDARTTYHCSYYNENETRQARPRPILPRHSLSLPEDKLLGDTTTKLSYQPVRTIFRAKPIFPRQRLRPQQGPMECQTTFRKSYEPKYMPRAEMIIPCGNIRTSKALFNPATTTLLSYMNPGPIEPVSSYKPNARYCKPTQPTANETTQKLSYLPYEIGRKENYPWAQKPAYRPPEVAMPADTTYKKTYLENKAKKETPILPKDEGVLPQGDEFFEKTIYRESFPPQRPNRVAPILPCPSIPMSEGRMATDTTNKMSYQPVRGERRAPILPRRGRKILADNYSIQNCTTTQLSYMPKIAPRIKPVLPCGHIHTASSPLEDKTITALSFANPGPTCQLQSFKPHAKYCKPDKKLEGETVNKMSYPGWSIKPKERLPWAEKKPYKPPKDTIAGTTIYHMSFPAPGYYEDECNDSEPDEEPNCDESKH